MRRSSRIFVSIVAVLAGGVVLAYAAVFFAIRFGWTNVSGEIDPNSALYSIGLETIMTTAQEPTTVPNVLPANESIYGPNEMASWCRIGVAADVSEMNAASILRAYTSTHSELLLERMLLALSFRVPDRTAFIARLDACAAAIDGPTLAQLTTRLANPQGENLYAWQTYEPWQVIRQALDKDIETINRAAEQAGVQPRMLVSVAIVEQLRLYYTQRELFEKVFRPLKILASANKMAWGILSIKEAAAIGAERHLKDPASSYYLGPDKEQLLDFPSGVNVSAERYRRLTSERDHTYSYLYGAVIIKQFEAQWARAGYPIEYRPEIIATLFNLGFNRSQPKYRPEVGGSTITIEGKKYFFGSLAYEFYYSGELIDEFPYK